MYPDIAKRPEFAFDLSGYWGTNTLYIMPTDKLYLLAILNSTVVEYFYAQISSTVRGDYMRFIATYLAHIPIPEVSTHKQQELETIVAKLLDTHGQGPQVAAWERELNEIVYRLYDLTEEEIQLIEETVGGG